jgi:hypothetical protein
MALRSFTEDVADMLWLLSRFFFADYAALLSCRPDCDFDFTLVKYAAFVLSVNLRLKLTEG